MKIYFQERIPPDVYEDLALEFEEDYSDRRSDDPDAPQAVRLFLDTFTLRFHVFRLS